MNSKPNALWLSVSPHLRGFDQRLLAELVKTATVRRWDYCQTADEPCCTEAVIEALHGYLTERSALENSWQVGTAAHKVHLLGHGLSGVMGLLYARRYPQHVASLTLLSVNSLPALNWQAHYYGLREQSPCSRERILAQMTQLLFGEHPRRFSQALTELLVRDLDNSLTLHSLAQHSHIDPSPLEVPVLVCNGEADVIMQVQQELYWEQWRQADSRAERSAQMKSPESFSLWRCPQGNHFFHFHHPQLVAATISSYLSQRQEQVVQYCQR
jgi:pimeloyl-ACP methyl ester carboxylesterase